MKEYHELSTYSTPSNRSTSGIARSIFLTLIIPNDTIKQDYNFVGITKEVIMKKHAFLIIAHSNEDDLINLIKSIDFEYNDIYIHIDKKWKDCNFDRIKSAAKYSPIYFSKKRYSVIWGASSQIAVELQLFELAVQQGEDYQYMHLLSGQDICIKSPMELHKFFDENDGSEFLCFCGKDWQIAAQDRVKYYHLNCGRNSFKRKLNNLYIKMQKALGIDRLKKSNLIVCGGSNWASITNSLANYLVENKAQILKIFSHSNCADELYKHTYAFNSEFKNKIYYLNTAEINDDNDPNMYIANMRYIDWNRGNPYLFVESDIESIKSSPCMFIRKVSNTNNLPSMILIECISSDDTRNA